MIERLTSIQYFAVAILPIIFAVTIHEVAHGFMAKLLGDKTALLLGRLTLNPVKHIDLIGTIIVPVFLLFFGGIIFGWAKPVPINAHNFRYPRRDMMLVACAGPSANFLMAIAWAIITKLGIFLSMHNVGWALAIVYMGLIGIQINLLLAVLNLLPLPPLDGGHIALGLLPNKLAALYSRIAPWGLFILLILIFSGRLFSSIINPIVYVFDDAIHALFNLPFGM